MKAQAMIMPKKYFFDKDGNPLAFGKVYTYQTGTVINKESFTTEAGDVANTNPVILNGEGYASIYLNGSYNIVVDDANDNNIWTEDPVSSSIAEEWVNCETPAYLSTTSFKIAGNVTDNYGIGRRVRIDNNTASFSYSTITSSSFAAGETTITVKDSVVQVGIVGVCASIVGPESDTNDEILFFETLDEAKASLSIFEKNQLKTGDRGGAFWNVVLASGVTPNTRNIIQCTGDTDLALVLEDEASTIIASHWGMSPTGTVDIDTYKALVAESTTSGRSIQFKQGTYDFDNQNVYDGGLVRGQDVGALRVIGGMGGTTIFENIVSAHYGNEVFSRDIHYKDCVQPLYTTGVLKKFDVRFNEFSGNTRSIYHNDSAVGASWDNITIEDNIFRDTEKDDFVGCILFSRAPEGKNATVKRNKFININTSASGSNIVLLCQFGTDISTADQAYTNSKFKDNYITGCGNLNASYQGSASFGCIIYGIDNEQHNNVIKDNKWFEPLYTKGFGNSQDNNKLRNNQHSGISQKVLALPSNASKQNTQNGNVIEGQCDVRAAVRLFGDGMSINSQVDITTTSEVLNHSQGGLAYQATRSTSIGKLTVTGVFNAPKGIQIDTAGDLEVGVTLTSETNGLLITDSVDGNLGTVNVSGKINSIDQALNVNWCERFDTSGLEVICDRHDGDSVFVQSSEYSNLDRLSVHVTDRANDGLDLVGYAISLFGESTATEDVVHKISDMVFKTDRNITVAPFRFSNLGSNDMSVYINDTVINMKGKTAPYISRMLSNMDVVNFNNLNLKTVSNDDISARTLEGSGFTVNKLLVNNGTIDTLYNAGDLATQHTNATILSSRTGNNKTTA